jgi:enolase
MFRSVLNSRRPQKVRCITTVYHHLGSVLAKKYGVSAKNLGDEGGFAPPLDNADEALTLIEDAIVKAGFKVGKDVNLALDWYVMMRSRRGRQSGMR